MRYYYKKENYMNFSGSISEGGSTKEVLGADYLGSMLKMETDDYADAQPISNAQQPDLLKMCRNRYEGKNDLQL